MSMGRDYFASGDAYELPEVIECDCCGKAICKQTRRWTMRNGTKIHICDMTDQHLLNTIRMIQYGAEIRRAANHGLRVLASRADDPDDVLAEATRMWEEDWYDYLRDPDMYDALFADAERRYLTTLEPKSCHLDFVALAAKARAI